MGYMLATSIIILIINCKLEFFPTLILAMIASGLAMVQFFCDLKHWGMLYRHDGYIRADGKVTGLLCRLHEKELDELTESDGGEDAES